MRGFSVILSGTAMAAAQPAMAASAATGAESAPQSSEAAGEIVVTATKTGATQLQDTALAITAFDTTALDRSGIKDVRDLMAMTPNLAVTQNGAFPQLYIRGIGSNNAFAGSDPSSTIHSDGVYLARPVGYITNYLDVERIEVLRGPQGTLYGRNSVGGTINVISRKPGDRLEAKGQVTLGNYDLVRLEGYVSGPLDSTISASVSMMGSWRDGYHKNVGPFGGRVDDEGVWGGRAQLRLTPSPAFELLIRGDYSDAKDSLSGSSKLLQAVADPVANSVLGDYSKVALNIVPFSQRRLWGLAGDASYELSDVLKLKSLTAYRGSRLRTRTDTDATTINTRQTQQFERQHQWSEEVNLVGDLGQLSFILGGYFFDEHIEADTSVTTFGTSLRVNYAPVVDTRALAGFLQATYEVTPQISLTAGMRYTDEEKTFAQRATNFSTVTGLPLPTYPRTYTRIGKYKAWTPKFGVEYRPADGVLLYASATKGFKSGGFNLASANPAQGFAPETLWSYEAGTKLTLLDRALILNVNYFHYDYKNLQVQSFLTPGVIDITNASDAKIDGVEVESVIRPTDWLRIGANLTYLDARYVNYPSALKAGNIQFDASGNRLSLTPKWAQTLWGEITVPTSGGSVFARGEYSYRTRQFFTAVNGGFDQQAGYGLINASLGYSFLDNHVEVTVYGRNLGNTQYVTTTASFAAGIVGKVGEPRTIGLRAAVKY